MKIAIASDDEKKISSHFGRTKCFIIFEVEGKEIKGQEYIDNTFTGHARGLEGLDHTVDRHTPIINILKDCKVVISHGMGRRIYDDLKRTGIEVYITDETEVKKTIDLYLSGKLINRPEMNCEYKH
jgi:predicted Fe-Mo cluster-binding NifX family protein